MSHIISKDPCLWKPELASTVACILLHLRKPIAIVRSQQTATEFTPAPQVSSYFAWMKVFVAQIIAYPVLLATTGFAVPLPIELNQSGANSGTHNPAIPRRPWERITLPTLPELEGEDLKKYQAQGKELRRHFTNVRQQMYSNTHSDIAFLSALGEPTMFLEHQFGNSGRGAGPSTGSDGTSTAGDQSAAGDRGWQQRRWGINSSVLEVKLTLSREKKGRARSSTNSKSTVRSLERSAEMLRNAIKQRTHDGLSLK